MRSASSCPFCGTACSTPRTRRSGLVGAFALGLALTGCDSGDDTETTMATMPTDGVESDSAGEATYGVPMSESEGDTTTTGLPDTDSGDTDPDASESSSSGGGGSSSGSSGGGSSSGSSGGGSSSSSSG